MEHRNTTTTGTMAGRGNPNMAAGNLQRLNDLEDCKVADNDPDIRGWDVFASDGRKIGEVDSLIVDTQAMQVRYLDLELDRKGLDLKEDRHVIVPIGGARLDDSKDNVHLTGMTVTQLVALPPYRHGEPIAATGSRDHETDAKQFYGRRGGTGGVERLTLSEEQLRVGTRPTTAGEARVQKSVETTHVSQKVPLKHEELVIETRAIEPGTPARGKIAEGEVRIPLMAEEAVVEKRAVAKEEVVISKKVVQDEKTVQADLRSEHLDVDNTTTNDRNKRNKH